MSFITDEEKADLDSVMNEVHATFAKTIFAHSDGELTVLSYDPDYSSVYGSPTPSESSGATTVAPIETEFQGRILFADKMDLKIMDVGDGNSLKLRTMDGEVRVKVDAVGKAVLEKAKKVEISNELYQFDTGPRPHGLFSFNFYTYYLRRLE